MKLDKTLEAIKGLLDRHKQTTTKALSQMAAVVVELNEKVADLEARQEKAIAAEKADKSLEAVFDSFSESLPQDDFWAEVVSAMEEAKAFDNVLVPRIEKAAEPLKAEIAELRSRQEDAPPVELDVSEVVKELLAADGVKQIVGLEVEAYMAENPPAAGKDGDKGDPGEPGKSVTLDDVSLFLDAAVAKHVLDFERRANETLAKAIDKIPAPKDGRDGVDLTEIGMDFDGERTVTIKGRTGEVTKRLPVPLWRGYWSPGSAAETGDILTHNGTAYIAIVDNPKGEPGVGKYDHEWKVFARKGTDGKHGRNGIDKTKPVDLKPKKAGDDA